jgi:16S rRNA (guanine527-N7)-methyltransferase
MIGDCRQLLQAGLTNFKMSLPAESGERLARYFEELKKWNRKINLIAKGTVDQQIIENHFLDSLTLLPLLTGVAPHLLDIGSGAGFPGLVCKAARPELAVTLVEPRAKRVSFLSHMVRTLGLNGVTILACRVEDEAQLPSAQAFTHITSRAVSEIGSFLRMVERFAPTGARVICMKGPKWQEELTAAATVLASSPYRLTEVVEHVLPDSGARRSLLLFSGR